MQTAYDLVWLAAERTPDQIALVDDRTERTLTYRELIEEADAVAAGLLERGIAAGSRVATALPNLFEHCIALIALQRIAAVPVLMNFRLHPKQLAEMMRQASVQAALVLNDAATTDAVAPALPSGGFLLSVGGSSGGAVDFRVCRGDTVLLPPRPAPDPQALSFIFFTSGTTGRPKAAMVSHAANEHRIVYMGPMFGMRQGSDLRSLGVSPLFHAIGFYGLFLATLAFNGTYYTMSAFDPLAAVSMIERHKISFLFAIPTVLQGIVSAANYRPERMASLRLVLFGGAPIAPLLLERMAAEWPADLQHAYGTTEVMTPLYQPHPVGRPRTMRPGYTARIRVIRPGGSPDDIVPPGMAGELIVDAARDSLFSGYLDMPEATADKVRDGWYFTGDICIALGNGEVDLVGRVDDMIRSGGEAIYPEEVESVLVAHPAVREACVVGIPDPVWGDLVVACIVPAEPPVTWHDLDAHCLGSSLAKYKRPRAYYFMDALPRNAANKVARRQLQEDVKRARGSTESDLFQLVAA